MSSTRPRARSSRRSPWVTSPTASRCGRSPDSTRSATPATCAERNERRAPRSYHRRPESLRAGRRARQRQPRHPRRRSRRAARRQRRGQDDAAEDPRHAAAPHPRSGDDRRPRRRARAGGRAPAARRRRPRRVGLRRSHRARELEILGDRRRSRRVRRRSHRRARRRRPRARHRARHPRPRRRAAALRGARRGIRMSYARRALAVAWKDLAVERRSKETLNALVFFSLLLLFVFQFTLGGDRERLAAVLPGVLWLGFVLSALLALGRTFLVEREHDCWEGLLLAPGDKSAIYLGKLAGNLALMLVVEALVLGLFVVFFDIDLGRALPGLLVVVLLGTLGLAAVGTLFAAMTANVRARELLFPVLLLPVQVPVLLATVKATEALLLGEPLGAVAHWVKLLVAADVIYVVVSLLTFDVVLEG